MSDKRKDHNELENTFNEKCLFLTDQLKQIESHAPGSILRNQYADGLSVVLRNLLIDRGSKQISLLTQLKISENLLFRAKLTGLSGPNNLVSESKLVSYTLSNEQLMYVSNENIDDNNYILFDTWLNEIVIDNKDPEDNLVTRRDVILVIADKEAAHTDSDYEKIYYKICVQKKMNFRINHNGRDYTPNNNLYKESLITITKEFLDAVKIYNLNVESKLRVLITNQTYLIMKNQLYHNGFGFRFNLWLPGDIGQGVAIFNRIHFAGLNHKSDYFLGSKLIYEYSHNGVTEKYSLLDFNQLLVQVYTQFIKEKNIFIAWYYQEGKILLMSGSQVGDSSEIDQKKIYKNNVADFLMSDLECKSKEDLGHMLNIDID